MRQALWFVLFVPLAVVVGIFTVENDSPVRLEIWPFVGSREAWVSVWVLGLLAVGIVIGMAIGWLSSLRWRRRAWRAERQVRVYERQQAEREEAEERAREAAIPPPPASGALPAPGERARRTALLGD